MAASNWIKSMLTEQGLPYQELHHRSGLHGTGGRAEWSTSAGTSGQSRDRLGRWPARGADPPGQSARRALSWCGSCSASLTSVSPPRPRFPARLPIAIRARSAVAALERCLDADGRVDGEHGGNRVPGRDARGSRQDEVPGLVRAGGSARRIVHLAGCAATRVTSETGRMWDLRNGRGRPARGWRKRGVTAVCRGGGKGGWT